MWVRCIKLFLLLHIIRTEVEGYGTPKQIVHQYSAVAKPWYKNSDRWPKSVQTNVKLRHSGHSKFPHLDGVMNKLNKYRTTTTKSPLWNRYGSKRKKDEFYENYEELEYLDGDDELDKDDDLEPDYDSWDNEDELKNDEDEYLEGNDNRNDARDRNYQAEEATEEPSTLTQYKWNHYGTRSRVEESRRNQMQLKKNPVENAAMSAIEHIRRINMEGKCNIPKLKVINVQTEHPNPAKRYLPHCTVLHRCSEDTGCCTSSDKKCQPKKQTLVHLYFYATKVGHHGNTVEKLSFYNHTECDCLKIGTTPMDVEPAPENLLSARSGLSVRAGNSLYGANAISCNCPEEYISKRRYDSKCVCDCASTNLDCINMKRGKEHFSLKDRKCILEDKCGVPTCEYGTYIRVKGRCPKKQEKIDAYANVSTSRTSLN